MATLAQGMVLSTVGESSNLSYDQDSPPWTCLGATDLDDPSLMPFSVAIFDCAILIFKTNHRVPSLAFSPSLGPLVPRRSHFMPHNTPLIYQL